MDIKSCFPVSFSQSDAWKSCFQFQAAQLAWSQHYSARGKSSAVLHAGGCNLRSHPSAQGIQLHKSLSILVSHLSLLLSVPIFHICFHLFSECDFKRSAHTCCLLLCVTLTSCNPTPLSNSMCNRGLLSHVAACICALCLVHLHIGAQREI